MRKAPDKPVCMAPRRARPTVSIQIKDGICNAAAKIKKEDGPQPLVSLALVREVEKVWIVSCRRCGVLRERLLGMGIHIDDEIMVVQKQNGGAVLIKKRGELICLGAEWLIKLMWQGVENGKNVS